MLTFYKNKSQTFECKIEIEGTNNENAEPRLILIPENDNKKIFFDGLVESGKCIVEVPPLNNISNKGKLKLEIYIEDTRFSPWESIYEIKEPVKVESVEIKKSNKNVRVIEDNVKLISDKSEKNNSIIRESASKRDKNLVKKYLNEFKKEKDKNLIKEFVNGEYFTPKLSTVKWAKGVLNNTKTNIAKTIMYYYDL